MRFGTGLSSSAGAGIDGAGTLDVGAVAAAAAVGGGAGNGRLCTWMEGDRLRPALDCRTCARNREGRGGEWLRLVANLRDIRCDSQGPAETAATRLQDFTTTYTLVTKGTRKAYGINERHEGYTCLLGTDRPMTAGAMGRMASSRDRTTAAPGAGMGIGALMDNLAPVARAVAGEDSGGGTGESASDRSSMRA